MRYLAAVCAILLMSFIPSSTVSFTDFQGSADGDNINLQWSTTQEVGIKDFAVEKASQLDESQFYQIGTVNPTGAGSVYQFVDRGIYKTTSGTTFRYRVRADGNDGSATYSSPILVTFTYSSNLSGVAKRTWGSIKAMFR